MTAFRFEPFTRGDLPLFETWLRRPHVRAAFGEPAEWVSEVGANLGERWVRHFRADLEGVPAGFVQGYDTALAPHGPWSAAPAGSIGIDFFLGEPGLLHRGLGTRLLREFANHVALTVRPKRLVLDPDPANLPSIRAARSVGFVHDPRSGLWLKELAPPTSEWPLGPSAG